MSNTTAILTPEARARIEDAEFMAQHGEHLERAATRLGFNSSATFCRFLDRHRRHDIITALKRNDGMRVAA